MDVPAANASNRSRPILGRSQTASPEVSPRQALHRGGVASQAARKLHLHTRHSSKDRAERDGQHYHHHHHHQHHHHHHALHQPSGRAIVETARHALPGSGSGVDSSGSNQGPLSDERGRRIVRPEDVDRERQRQDLRTEELRASLGSLAQLANSMTRQLDGIYYAILEKASALRAAVDSLQKLSSETVQLRRTFEADANDIKARVQGQIDEFDGLKGQEHTIADMEDRIKRGTRRAHALSDRLEQARQRVEQWEKREAEWQAKTSGRIRASIISVSCVLGGLLFLLFLRWAYLHTDIFGSAASVRSRLNDTVDSFTIPFHVSRPPRSRTAAPRQTPLEDPRLRIFDEL